MLGADTGALFDQNRWSDEKRAGGVMNTSYYRRRLAVDLPRWVEAGHVKPDGMRAILAEFDRDAGGEAAFAMPGRLVAALSLIGAILMGAGAISFVAANWQEMPRLVRLALMGGGIWASYGAGAVLFQRGLDVFAHGAVLFGSALFGASVMLVAQMYHLYGNPPDAVIVWAAGSLLAGLLFRSNPSALLSLGLVCLWGGWETEIGRGVFYPFLPALGAVAAVLYHIGCGYGVKAATVAFGVWVISLGYILEQGHAHILVLVIGTATAGAGVAIQQGLGRFAEAGRVMVVVGFAIGMAALFTLQFIEDGSLESLLVFAAVSIAAAISAIAWGLKSHDLTLSRTGYVGFFLEVVSLFVKTVGTLIGSSLFFVVTGGGVIGLAVLAYLVNKRMRAMQAGEGAKS